jgi:hypothetical protein
MKASDLRIGNLLLNDGIVVTIDARTIFDIWNDEGAKKYKPIPLTEKWLLKFGFEKVVYDSEETGYGTEYELKCSSDVFMVYEDDFSVALYSCKEVIGRDLSVIPTWNQVKTVHGLQNLYHALIGKELTLIEP